MDPDQTAGPRSDCSFSSLIWVHTVCLYAKCKFEKFARRCSRRHKQTTFSDAAFLGALRVKQNIFVRKLYINANSFIYYCSNTATFLRNRFLWLDCLFACLLLLFLLLSVLFLKDIDTLYQGCAVRRRVFGHMRTAKAQISPAQSDQGLQCPLAGSEDTTKECIIAKTSLYNVDPLKPQFYIVKLGFTGVYIIFLISAQKHRLRVLVRTASPRRF